MSVIIQEEDFVSSIADAIQFISYYHPLTTSSTLPARTSAKKALRPKMRWRKF